MLKIISGGQTGVDIAALRAAKDLGIPTGGFMPNGWATDEGPHPEYEELYGMEELLADYAARTRANVRNADVTLAIAHCFYSSGMQCTRNACAHYSKPMLCVDYPFSHSSNPERVALELIHYGLKDSVINVAGNRERLCPGIGEVAYWFLRKVFVRLIT